jgi:uncharacterized protein
VSKKVLAPKNTTTRSIAQVLRSGPSIQPMIPMKKTSLLLLLALIASQLTAQTTTTSMTKDHIKHIEVAGTAELEIVPDEIFVTISLKEYFLDEKSQKNKIAIETLEKQIVKAVAEAGIAKENLAIQGISGYKNWFGRKKPAIFLENKQYQLKVSNLYKIDEILNKVDDRGIEYTQIGRVDHSKKQEFRKQVKINALKAAKEKAEYLLESIGEQIGEVLEIRELEDNFYYPQPMMAQRNLRAANMAYEAADAAPADGGLEYQKIKVSYRMQAVFKIK